MADAALNMNPFQAKVKAANSRRETRLQPSDAAYAYSPQRGDRELVRTCRFIAATTRQPANSQVAG